MIKIAVGLILFLTGINAYLLSMFFGKIPFIDIPLDIYTMRTWFSGFMVLLVTFLILSIRDGISEKGQYECIIISLVSIGAAQLTVYLNGVHLIDKPYEYLLTFNICNILAFFTTFNYLSLTHNAGNNYTGD